MDNRYIDENEVLRDALSGLNDGVPPMPEDLHAAWMQKVEEDAMQKNSQPTRTRWTPKLTRFLSVAAALVFIIGGTALTRDDLADLSAAKGAGQNNKTIMAQGARSASYDSDLEEAADADYGMATSYDSVSTNASGSLMLAGYAAPEAAEAEPIAPEAAQTAQKKIIRNASLTIATQTYEESLATLKAGCEQVGGWIESSSESTNSSTSLRSAYLTLRIPQSVLDSYLEGAGGLGRVTYRSESASDVTASYQDTAARLATQQALMARLQSLITESASLADLLALESQMAETQYEIDRLQTSLNRTDRQVAYSTVDVTLREETAPSLTDESVSLMDRMQAAIILGWETFTAFLADMTVFLVAALPFIGVVAVVFIGTKIYLHIKRRNH